jgi:hypothetical protein
MVHRYTMMAPDAKEALIAAADQKHRPHTKRWTRYEKP